MINQPIIELTNVSKKHAGANKFSVENVCLSIEKGEILVFIGSSGSGKTTLLKLINGLEKPTSGSVFIKGQNLTTYNIIQLRRHFFGYVFQKVGLFPHMNIQENLDIVLQIAKLNPSARATRIHEILAFMNLDPKYYLERYPHQLSGGEQQRVGVARALITDSECLLMDEPFGALDSISRLSLQGEILRLKLDLKKTIVFVTHDIAEAFKLGDRIAVIKDGKIEQLGTKKDLNESPKTTFVEQMVNAGLRGLS